MSVLVDDGSSFIYHYDDPLDSQTYEHTAGRLAWVEEVTGTVQLGYDARGNEVRFHREIDDTVAQVQLSAEEVRTFSPSGLLREVDFQDGLAIALDYDDAGRPTSLGDLWEVESYDPAGRILAETFGNDVTQSYDYDVNGQPSEIGVFEPQGQGGAALYHVMLDRNAYGAVTEVTDLVSQTGLDHNATFSYDGAARLIEATIGSGSEEYSFGYAYDALQNMVEREVSGPSSLGTFVGEYNYGEGNQGPRQLTSITPLGDPQGTPIAELDYDLAGRQISQNDSLLTYNGLDQLIKPGHKDRGPA